MANSPDEVKSVRKTAREVFMQQFGTNCKAARGEMEIGVAAERLGVHRNTLWYIERGERLPDAFELELMIRVYNTTRDFLFTGQPSGKGTAMGVLRSVRAQELGDYIYVPHFDVRAAAGTAELFNDVERVKAMRPFETAYIRNTLGVPHNDLALIDISGNSMEPILHSGDAILVDLRSMDVSAEGIHVIRMDGALMVKKVQRLPGRVLRISSENPSYAPFDIQGGDDDTQRDFAIVGRALWAGVTVQ